MTFAIGEITVYLAAASLLGLLVGYMLWYRRIVRARTETNVMASTLQERSATLSLAENDLSSALNERDHLRAQTDGLTTKAERNANEVETLRGQVSQLRPLADLVPELRRRIADLERSP